jgi:RNA polymerase sigma factor (sigma-70 family)
MRDIARAVSISIDESNELAAAVFADLFLPARSGESPMAGYGGQTALATWLRVIITRRALNERALKWNRVEHLDCLPEIADSEALTIIEKSLRANKYRRAINASIRCASLSLSERERLMLLMRYEDSMRMNDIALFFGVHPSTVTRQLQQAHRKLQNEILGALAAEYEASEGALEECLDDLYENPVHSILAAIKHT